MPDWLPQFLLNFMPVAFFAGCVYECVHELREKKHAKEVERSDKRRRDAAANLFDHGLITSNEVRSICNDHVQVAYTESVNVVGDNNTVSTTFYADNVQYLQINQVSERGQDDAEHGREPGDNPSYHRGYRRARHHW